MRKWLFELNLRDATLLIERIVKAARKQTLTTTKECLLYSILPAIIPRIESDLTGAVKVSNFRDEMERCLRSLRRNSKSYISLQVASHGIPFGIEHCVQEKDQPSSCFAFYKKMIMW